MAGTAFVGRRGELERLGQVLRGDPGAGAVAVVTGDAGMGKTRLLAEVILAFPDVLVLAGGCLPMSEPLPYGAVSAALAMLGQRDSRPVLDQALSRCAPYVRPQISALIPALSEDTAGSSGAAADRTRLFAAVRDLLGALGVQRRTVLVVEDLHWADEGTLDVLTYLARGMPDGAALVVTSRRDELAAGDRTLDWLGSTVQVRGVESLALAALSDEDVSTLVVSLVDGEPLPSLMAEVLRRGEGNPFFTEQLVAAAHDAAPPVEVPAGVPAGVQPMLLGRIRSVGSAATEVAAALAVAARPLTESELTVCAGPDVDVVSGLRELLAAHLVDESEADLYRLRHALLEDTVRGTLLASTRRRLHAGVAAVLAGRGGESPAEIAAHWAKADNRVEEARWSVEAARQAERMYAWREASVLWRRIWELWPELEEQERPPVQYTDAVVSCVGAVYLAADVPKLMSLSREALADDRVVADDHATGQLLTHYGENLLFTDMAAGVAALEAAVAAFDRTGRPSAGQARALHRLVLAKLAKPAALTGSEAAELTRAAVIAEDVAATEILVNVAGTRGNILLKEGQVDAGLDQLTTALRLARAASVDLDESLASINLSDAYFWLLQPRDGVEVGQRSMEQLRHHGFEGTRGFSLLVNNTAQCLFLLGDCAGVGKLLAEHLPAELTAYGWLLHMSRVQLAVCAGDHNWPVPRVEDIEALGFYNDEAPTYYAEVSSGADLWRGKPRAAWQASERALATVRGSSMAWRGSQMLANTARAAADMAELDPETDRQALERTLRQWAEDTASFEPHPARMICAASGFTFEAELARLGRDGEEPAWHAAKDVWAEHGIPHNAAYAAWRLAECHLSAGRRRDAETELAIAHAAAESHVPLRREIEALARRARLPHPRRESPSQAAVAGESSDARYGLTPREMSVLRLLGTGATNAEIGKHLYMSPKTASVHVSAIIRKLGVSGRVQAATVAERMGLLEHEDGAGAPGRV